MDNSDTDIVTIARIEVERMQAAIASVGEATQVGMDINHFTRIAGLLDGLLERVGQVDEAEFGDPRYWVPLPQFQRIKAEASHWRSECHRLAHHESSFEGLLNF